MSGLSTRVNTQPPKLIQNHIWPTPVVLEHNLFYSSKLHILSGGGTRLHWVCVGALNISCRILIYATEGISAFNVALVSIMNFWKIGCMNQNVPM